MCVGGGGVRRQKLVRVTTVSQQVTTISQQVTTVQSVQSVFDRNSGQGNNSQSVSSVQFIKFLTATQVRVTTVQSS